MTHATARLQQARNFLLQLSPAEFEQMTGRLLSYLGFTLEVVGGAGDKHADLSGVDVHGRRTVVQCKRYTPPATVGQKEVTEFLVMAERHHGASRAIFATTSTYTGQARKTRTVEFYDGEQLAEMVLDFIPEVLESPREGAFRVVCRCPRCATQNRAPLSARVVRCGKCQHEFYLGPEPGHPSSSPLDGSGEAGRVTQQKRRQRQDGRARASSVKPALAILVGSVIVVAAVTAAITGSLYTGRVRRHRQRPFLVSDQLEPVRQLS